MKRIAVIVTLACLIVVMTTGSAFATVCTGNACGDPMVCAPSVARTCPMTGGPTMQHSMCDHGTQSQSREGLFAQQNHAPAAVVVSPIVLRPSLALGGLFGTLHAPDARGAPHLSAVMRN